VLSQAELGASGNSVAADTAAGASSNVASIARGTPQRFIEMTVALASGLARRYGPFS
jgi:hypothetical protein